MYIIVKKKMLRSELIMKKILLIAFLMCAVSASAENIRLPEPEKTGGMTLLESLTLRRTEREFADKDFNIQELSNLLYSAGGVNRPEGMLVYPVGMGVQDTKIYVIMREGVYEYNPQAHSLEQIEYGDHRSECNPHNEFAGKASVNLVYVHDLDAWQKFMTGERPIPKEAAVRMGMFHSGAIMQNVYLFAASQNWNCCVQGSFDNANLRELLKLNENQTITLLHSVGVKP